MAEINYEEAYKALSHALVGNTGASAILSAEDALMVEGLAAQLYVQSREGATFPWWHVMRDEIRQEYRRKAREQIAEFRRRNPF